MIKTNKILRCLNNGACALNGIGGFQCNCPPGFLGRLCDERDPCYNNGPCGANGKCIATLQGTATCQCSSGYTGARCDIKDPCTPSPVLLRFKN